jgi:hypothetical protein
MADLLAAAHHGNGPRVEVAPHMVAAEFRGLCQRGCCCRSVPSTRATRFHGRSIHLGLFSYRSMQELLNDAAKAGNLPDLLRSVEGHALPTLDPNFGFVRAAVRFHGRLFNGRRRCTLAWRHQRRAVCRILTEYATTRPNPFLVGVSGVVKNEPQCGCPPGPQPYPMDWVGWCEYPMRGVPLIGAHPLRNAPPCAGMDGPP